MDKKHKQHRQKTINPEELLEVAPPGASFNTEQGRAAQGMRADIGEDGARRKDAEEEQEEEKAAGSGD
jgi:hypothetical protein